MDKYADKFNSGIFKPSLDYIWFFFLFLNIKIFFSVDGYIFELNKNKESELVDAVLFKVKK